jgi:DNA mismatch endonuclease (patch repair protein)
MADVHSREVRSYNMSKIRGKNTIPEILVRKYLFSKGLRYKLHDKQLPGTPDIILPKYKTIIFVHGCFWHGHEDCKYYVVPKTRAEWWQNKINTNKANDDRAIQSLTTAGWNIITVWECNLKIGKREETLNALYQKITTSN